jgi:hypothetical protein
MVVAAVMALSMATAQLHTLSTSLCLLLSICLRDGIESVVSVLHHQWLAHIWVLTHFLLREALPKTILAGYTTPPSLQW